MENKEQIVQIESYSFWEFCIKVQEAIQNGYVFSEKNEYFPQSYIGNYFVTLVLQDKESKEQVKTSEVPDDKNSETPKSLTENPDQKEKGKPGRKASK